MKLITGACGFVGRRLAPALALETNPSALECWASPIDNAFERAGKCELRDNGMQYNEVDLSQPRSGWPAFGTPRQPRTVFHLAAETSTWSNRQAANDRGTDTLLDHLSPLGPEDHFIFTSTIATLDNRLDLSSPARDDGEIERVPLTRYGRSKMRAEEILEKRAREQGFRLTIVRLMTVFGANPRPNSIFDVLPEQVRRGSLATRLNWPGKTGFVHVDDVVEALLALSDQHHEPGVCKRYILNGEARTLAEVSELLHRGMGQEYRPIRLPKLVWRCLWAGWLGVKALHRILPARLFNPFWRAHLVMGDVFSSESQTLARLLNGRAPRTIAESLNELVPVRVEPSSGLSPTGSPGAEPATHFDLTTEAQSAQRKELPTGLFPSVLLRDLCASVVNMNLLHLMALRRSLAKGCGCRGNHLANSKHD